ncbi:hypothetical protein DK59_2961 [Brucella abortus bv. 4 str. 292]|nr:hypothetical protein DK59_2961 [Brucella abortus bv. 4 str. 292]
MEATYENIVMLLRNKFKAALLNKCVFNDIQFYKLGAKACILANHEKRMTVCNGDCWPYFRLLYFVFRPDCGGNIYVLPETVRFRSVRPQAPRPKDYLNRTNFSARSKRNASSRPRSIR